MRKFFWVDCVKKHVFCNVFVWKTTKDNWLLVSMWLEKINAGNHNKYNVVGERVGAAVGWKDGNVEGDLVGSTVGANVGV